MKRYVWKAWLICGTLDIVYAAIMSLMQGGRVDGMLRVVASGPFGAGVRDWGMAGAAAGLLVHFAMMAVMVLAYGLVVTRTGLGRLNPWIAGLGYGLMLYLILYWIVLPLRWPTIHPSTDPATVASALFAHIGLVGWPMALIARRTL